MKRRLAITYATIIGITFDVLLAMYKLPDELFIISAIIGVVCMAIVPNAYDDTQWTKP